jgi:hypothetical protein
MLKEVIESVRNEAKAKPFIGKVKDGSDISNYAVNLDDVPNGNTFPKLPFGRKLDSLKYVRKWIKDAKEEYIDCKGKPTLSEVKKWAKENSDKQFYAKWTADSDFFKDDVVLIYVK